MMLLNVGEVLYLKNYFPDATEISLFKNLEGSPDGSEKDSLEGKGVLVEGKLAREAREMLDVMAGAGQGGRIVLRDPFMLLERYTYRVGDSILMVANEENSLRFGWLDDFSKVSRDISHFTGNSGLITARFEDLLTHGETAVLCAVWDLQRTSSLESFLGKSPMQTAFSAAEVEKALEEPVQRGILEIIRSEAEGEFDAPSDLQATLDSLAQKEILEYEDGWALTDEFYLFGISFLVPELVGGLDLLNLDSQGMVMHLRSLFISAGARNNLNLVFTGDGIEVSSLPAEDFIGQAEGFLRCPDFQQE